MGVLRDTFQLTDCTTRLNEAYSPDPDIRAWLNPQALIFVVRFVGCTFFFNINIHFFLPFLLRAVSTSDQVCFLTVVAPILFSSEAWW